MIERIDGSYTQTALDSYQRALENQRNLLGEITAKQQEIAQKSIDSLEKEKKEKPEIKKILEEPIDAIKSMRVIRYYDVDKELNWTIVSVLHPETYRLIRQIPSKTTVDIARYLHDILGKKVDMKV